MDTAKFIRTLGYIIWVILWLPVSTIVIVASPLYLLVEWVLSEDNPKWIYKYWSNHVSKHFKRGMHFIETGEWCKEDKS